MPEIKKGETREQFMGRCIPIRHKEHPTEKNEQSVAVCFSMWRKAHPKDKKAENPKDKSNE
jgi:hypothetical protein